MLVIKKILNSGYFYTFITTGLVYGSKYILDQYIGISQNQNNYFVWNKIQSLALVFCQLPFFATYLSGLPKLNSFKDIKGNNSLNAISNSLLSLFFAIILIVPILLFLNFSKIINFDSNFIVSSILFTGIFSFQITQTTLRSFLKFKEIFFHAIWIPIVLFTIKTYIDNGPLEASLSLAVSFFICTLLTLIRLKIKFKEKVVFKPFLFLTKSYNRGINVYLFSFLTILITEGDKLIISLSAQNQLSSSYLFFRNSSIISFVFASVISSTFYPKILNKVSGDFSELKKYILKVNSWQILLSTSFSLVFSVTSTIFFYLSNNQYISKIFLMYIFILTTIPAGSLMLSFNTINALNKEIKAIKIILPIVVLQIFIQINFLNKISITIYALTHAFFIVIYLLILNRIIKEELKEK